LILYGFSVDDLVLILLIFWLFAYKKLIKVNALMKVSFWASLFAIPLVLSYIFANLFSGNMLFARFLNVSYQGHDLVFLAYLFVFSSILIVTRNAPKAFFVTMAFIGSYELNVFAVISSFYEQQYLLRTFELNSATFMIYIVLLVIVFDSYKKEFVIPFLSYIMMLLPIDALWIYIGYPYTLDNIIGYTQWYHNIFVNFIEIEVVVINCSVFMLAWFLQLYFKKKMDKIVITKRQPVKLS